MITIGLPRGLYYFKHYVLWEEFFRNLGCDIVVSDETNKHILDMGVKYCSNETCLPVKVFHGHVMSLKDKVDYIFIPRYISVDKNEYTCPNFCGLPDMTALNLKNQVKILDINVHIDMFPYLILKSLKELGKVLNLEYSYVVNALKEAYLVFTKKQESSNNFEPFNSIKDKTKISLSILGHPYMIYDSYLSMKLIEKLNKRNISIYTPDNIDNITKRINAYPFQGKIFWDIGFELLGSAFTFTSNEVVDGIIYLTPFACGVDAFILEFIQRRFKSSDSLPILKLTVDEHTGEAGFDTRVEAFLDMVG
ncbi:UNVERIFIED_CONTAM: putative nucleotide-binding protein (sugar kinase/HSP70/actin superfamily) [Acetivibrio alkalicellulosi]